MKSCLVAGLFVVLFGLTGVAQEKTQRESAPKASAEPKAAVVSTNQAAARETYTVIGYLESAIVSSRSSPVRKARCTAWRRRAARFCWRCDREQLRAQARKFIN